MIRRYLRAAWIALKLTVRGEHYLPPSPYPQLMLWVREAEALVDTIYRIADEDGLDDTARQKIVVVVDGRQMSMALILASVKYNMQREYPQLLRTRIDHNLTAFYAGNLNDRYRMQRLCEAESRTLFSQSLEHALQTLKQHLEAVPQVESPPKYNS